MHGQRVTKVEAVRAQSEVEPNGQGNSIPTYTNNKKPAE